MAPPTRPPDVRDTAARTQARLTNPRLATPIPHPAPAPAPTPWWMLGPAALQQQATAQASAYYQPALDELHAQQKEAARQAAANLAGIQRLIQAVQSSAQGLGGGISAAFQHGANADYGSSDMADSVRNMFAQEGNAYSNIGNAFGLEAGNAGQAQYLNAVQDSNKISRDLLGQISDVTGKIPGAAQDIYNQLLSAQYKYRAGVASQQKQATAEYNQAYNRALQTAKFYTQSTHVLYVVQDTPQGPQIKEARDKKGQTISTVGLTPYQVAEIQARAQSSSDLNSYRQQTLGQGQQRINQGQQRIDAAARKAARPKPPTAAVIRAGWKAINDSYYHPIGSTRRLTVAELDQKIKQTNAARLKDWQDNADHTKHPNPPKPLARADLARLTPSQKRLLGIAGTETAAQDVYINLVHSGIRPKKAWSMVRKYYPGFGSDYFQ